MISFRTSQRHLNSSSSSPDMPYRSLSNFGSGWERSTVGGVTTPMLSHSIMSDDRDVRRSGMPAKTIFEVLPSGRSSRFFFGQLVEPGSEKQQVGGNGRPLALFSLFDAISSIFRSSHAAVGHWFPLAVAFPVYRLISGNATVSDRPMNRRTSR